MKAIDYALAATADPASALFGKVDAARVVLAGHSMGASDVIEAGRKLPRGTARVAIAQHPGLCGPIGPPPWPATWMKSDLEALTGANALPLVLTTATNDGAFRPAPHTAEKELDCWQGGVAENGTAVFAQFSADACAEDNDREPDWTDGGHDCPLKLRDGGAPEMPWVLAAAKLYAQLDGDAGSACHAMIWGDGADSLNASSDLDLVQLHP